MCEVNESEKYINKFSVSIFDDQKADRENKDFAHIVESPLRKRLALNGSSVSMPHAAHAFAIRVSVNGFQLTQFSQG